MDFLTPIYCEKSGVLKKFITYNSYFLLLPYDIISKRQNKSWFKYH